VYQHLLRHAEWPKIPALQRDLDRRDRDYDVESVAQSKPTSVGVIGDFGPAELTLQLRHLVHLPEAAPLVTVCMNAIKLAEQRYLDFDETPQISSGDTITQFPSDASGGLAMRAFKVLMFEHPSPFGGSSYRGETWELSVDTRTARSFRDVMTATAFIERQDELALADATLRTNKTTQAPGSESRGGETLFLSWSGSRSNGVASRLAPILEARLPGVEVFFSPESIEPGADPSRALYEDSLIPARALVVVLTPESAASAYVIWETAAAWGRRQLVIPVFAGVHPADVPGPLATKVEGVFIEDRQRMDRALAVIAQEFGVTEAPVLTDEEWTSLGEA
jgi:hypothetical protein